LSGISYGGVAHFYIHYVAMIVRYFIWRGCTLLYTLCSYDCQVFHMEGLHTFIYIM